VAHISIIGTGTMGQAISAVVTKGFLQITPAAGEKVVWTGGLAVIS